MGRETVVAAGAMGAGIAAAGLGAAYLVNRYMINQRPAHRSQQRGRSTEYPREPYMSIYMPTRTADLILPMRRNGRTTNAFGYLHS